MPRYYEVKLSASLGFRRGAGAVLEALSQFAPAKVSRLAPWLRSEGVFLIVAPVTEGICLLVW